MYAEDLLATLPTMVHDPSGGRDPQVENHWYSIYSGSQRVRSHKNLQPFQKMVN